MDSNELKRAERRARLKYEWARLRRALVGFAPALLVVLGAAIAGTRPTAAVGFGGALFVTGVFLLWYGQDVRRAVLPGVLMGLAPLVLVLCANHLGHRCTGDSCMSWCVPACVAGGIMAGIGVGLVGGRSRHGAGYWVGASLLTLLTGAMGCACVGYSGVFGLVLGYGAGFVSALIPRLRRG